MRRLYFLASIFALIVTSAGALAQNGGDTFAKANQEYADGRFGEAAELYQNLISAGETDAALFYNLANAHFRNGDFGRAILNYERALVLEPHHPEAEANLRLVRDKARALELRRGAIERAASQLTITQYMVLAAGSFWLALFVLAGLTFSRRRSPGLVLLFIVALVLFCFEAYGLYALETGSRGRTLAVVTAKNTEARLATADNAGTVLALPSGSEIKILSTRGDWVYASLPNDLRGWIPAQSAERVRL